MTITRSTRRIAVALALTLGLGFGGASSALGAPNPEVPEGGFTICPEWNYPCDYPDDGGDVPDDPPDDGGDVPDDDPDAPVDPPVIATPTFTG